MHHRVRPLFFAAALLAAAVPAAAQSTAQPHAAALAQGWARLAKGDATGAAADAARALALDPLSISAVSLAIEAALFQGDATAALDAYERWLKTRRLDSAYALRRVALGVARQVAGSKTHPLARVEALKVLAADGDRDAMVALDEAAAAGSFNDARALASLGNERAIQFLIKSLESAPGHKGAFITALAESGSKLAIAPLRKVLADPMDVHRAAAADALGRLGATEAVPQLRALLEDPFFAVRLEAAGALYRLNDTAGLAVLQEAAASEHAAIRVAAARELSAQPDATWQALVRSLVNDPDPVVRLDAARLLAPYDRDLADKVLRELASHENIAVREAASGVLVEQVAADLATLRGLLRNPDERVRVKAAGRLLELTR